MSIIHVLTCDLCHITYCPHCEGAVREVHPVDGSVGEMRTWARKEGWHVRHGDPDLCPTCFAVERAEQIAYATRRTSIRTAVKKGAKQADVARELGLSRQRISQIMKGA